MKRKTYKVYIEVTSTDYSLGRIVVDGQDISNIVTDVRVNVTPGAPARVQLELAPDIIEIEGMFEVEAAKLLTSQDTERP